MKTTVVNARKSPYDVYIGRPGRGVEGPFGNPIREMVECPECSAFHTSRAALMSCFKTYFERRVAQDLEFRAAVLALRGKRLGCFCVPGLCHGDVIAAWVNAHES